jgi:tRNA G26 N,N-dimethylase Trm1
MKNTKENHFLIKIFFYNFSANEICKSKNKSKITVKDVLEAMEKAGFENFQPEIENLLMGK